MKVEGTDFDSIIVLGGDGTFIRAARQHLDMNVPMLGLIWERSVFFKQY